MRPRNRMWPTRPLARVLSSVHDRVRVSGRLQLQLRLRLQVNVRFTGRRRRTRKLTGVTRSLAMAVLRGGRRARRRRGGWQWAARWRRKRVPFLVRSMRALRASGRLGLWAEPSPRRVLGEACECDLSLRFVGRDDGQLRVLELDVLDPMRW